eukprot:CAMPEP_0194221122 /NCGR_PEP_ID=MMETSP0156-20130528/29938_1 /TAXON_ID=33649 /ORGANISM="Thalassionema nitzschioides, Strain L26-B" /LENGTH=40 /DNA_ID= /DNA_START= /DNA_END= /DNA_ORIENTATION=
MFLGRAIIGGFTNSFNNYRKKKEVKSDKQLHDDCREFDLP